MRSNPKYVNSYWDRHGKLWHYFRRKGQPNILLPAPGSPEFEKAYAAALTASKPMPSPNTEKERRRAREWLALERVKELERKRRAATKRSLKDAGK
jgi:hypothetical protein